MSTSYYRDVRPEVTVVIPTRDRWPILSTAALPAALEQRAVDLEIVIVDDGSSDVTSSELASLDDSRVRVIRHDAPRGVAPARNEGIKSARGDWVAFLDDDDLWAPEKLREQLDAAHRSEASFAYTSAAWIDPDRRFIYALAAPEPENLAGRLLRWNEIWAGGSNVIARTEVVRRLGGFDEQLFKLADWDLWIRLALDGHAAAVPDVLVGYVMHRRSMLLADDSDVFAEFGHLVDKHRKAAAAAGAGPDRAKFWRWEAENHLRAGRSRDAARVYARGARESRDPRLALRAAAVLSGRHGERAARALVRRWRGDDDAKLDAPEPHWIGRYRDGSVN